MSECADDGEVQFAAGDVSNRLRAIDVLFLLQALRRQLEGPGKDQCQGERHQHEDRHQGHRPIGQLENRKGRGRDLNQYPGCDRVGNCNFEDVAAFEFVDNGHDGYWRWQLQALSVRIDGIQAERLALDVDPLNHADLGGNETRIIAQRLEHGNGSCDWCVVLESAIDGMLQLR